jgi:type 1 glutamine amidotransferase
LFTVDIVDPDHPVTRGLAAFETDDELYTCLAGNRPVRVIASAKSKVDGRDYPMAFVFDYGQGRVFHTVLGHDLKAITNSTVRGTGAAPSATQRIPVGSMHSG